jgi:methylase of polypeptide subunit release factors
MTQQHDLLHWYEASLPVHERKNRGHFSTPPLLVEQILDACGYTPEQELSRLRILDPACGSGNFLAGATQRLIRAGKAAGLSQHMIARHIQQNIWGFDPDPIACFLAEMQVRTSCKEHQITDRLLRRLHIHQADGLAFPWEQETSIDLFLANPPYLAAKNTDLSGYRSAQQRGQADSYLLFLSLALQVVRPGGWIALVLPDPVLARVNATRERERLLKETTVHQLWHLADVFTAYVGAVVIVAQKCPPPAQHCISWKRERWRQQRRRSQETDSIKAIPYYVDHHQATHHPSAAEQTQQRIAQALLQRQPGTELRYLLSTIHGTLLERIHTHYVHGILANRQNQSTQTHTLTSLGGLVLIHRGEELGKDSPLLRTTPPEHTHHTERWYPTLRGGTDIRPYCYPTASRWIEASHVVKPLTRYLQPKLLLVKSVGNLQATLDLQDHIVLQTLYILQLKPQQSEVSSGSQFSIEEELYFLLALLNSHLLQQYVHVLHTAYKLVQPQIEQHVLAHLPIPMQVPYTEKKQIICRAQQLMEACSTSIGVVELQAQSKKLYEEQEQAICTLYENALYEPQHKQYSAMLSNTIDKGVSTYG